MAEEYVMGRQVKFGDGAARRCDFCHKPVKFGYVVSEGECTGFFCGPRHFNTAAEVMKDVKQELDIK